MNFLKNRKRSHSEIVFSEDCDNRNFKRKIVVLPSTTGKNTQIPERTANSHQTQEGRVHKTLNRKRSQRTVTANLLFNGHCDEEKLHRKRKQNLSAADLHELNCIHPIKKPRLDLVKLFDQQIVQQELDHEIFKLVRLCRYESDLNSSTFFEKLEI